jgi:voltage-gated potassium channel
MPKKKLSFQLKLHKIIFGTNTPAGKGFDVVLLWFILFSVLIVVLESVDALQEKYSRTFVILEWVFTVSFTIEFIARIYSHPKPLKYVFSFFGIIDLLAILPAYFGIFFHGPQFLFIRVVRLLRVFRVLKLSRYIKEAKVLQNALRSSFYKITIFFGIVMTLVLILGSVMYFIEGKKNGFTSIPESMYWAIVTITTVGYGDIAPQTVPGKMLASLIMILGYSIIAVPTGIVTAEFSKSGKKKSCKNCGTGNLPATANFCQQCGDSLLK